MPSYFVIIQKKTNQRKQCYYKITLSPSCQLSIGLAVVCVPLLRYTHPDLERPIKVNLVWPILYIIATIFITIVPMIAAPIETGEFGIEEWKLGFRLGSETDCKEF